MNNEPFLAAIRDEPDDQTHRLVFADWLDDNGEGDRAELIRLQVRLEMNPAAPDRASLEAKSCELTKAHGERWLAGRPDSLQTWSFRGGLVDRLVFQPTATLAEIRSFLVRHPISEIVLPSTTLLPALARSPELELVRGLIVGSLLTRLTARAVECLLDSHHLVDLRLLGLSGQGVDNYLARVLAQSSGVADLRVLRLANTFLRDAGVVQLLRPGVLTKLEEWSVHCPLASSIALANLFTEQRILNWKALSWYAPRSANLGSLERLGLCRNLTRLQVDLPSGLVLAASIPDESKPRPRVLRWLKPLKQLRELELSGALTDAVIEELSNWPGLARLERLRLNVGPSRQEEVRDTLAASAYRNPATVVTM